MLVIADADRPQAVGGVMGGLGSEVSERTTDLLLEAALFDPLSVRRTSRALKLQSDSSYRYERGVDPMGVDRASLRAARLILELAGGSLAQGVIRVGPLAEQPPEPHVVRLRPQRCRSLLGIDVPTPAMLAYLDALGLKPKAEENEAGITCTIPSFRLDLTREVDLIEEVARLHGLEKIEVRSKVQIRARPKQPAVAAREAMGHALVGLGFHETITDSLMSPRVAEPFVAEGCAPMVLDESLSWGANTLRPSLLPSLLACRKRNEDRGNQGLRLFEAATTWSRDPQGEPREEERLGLLVEGQEAQECLRDLRGAIEETLERLVGDEPVRFVVAQNEPHLSPAAQIHLDGQPIGRLGLAKLEAPEAVLKEDFGLHGPGAPSVAVAELALRGLLREDYPPERQVGELPKFPSIERDLSVILDEAVTWEQVEASLRASQPELLESLAYVTTYRGKPLSKGQKSLTLRLRFRHPDKTLRREEVDPQVEAVVRKLRDDLNAELRTA
jgi:phenylalanyl-tRNA synthetase beta chain